MDTMSMFGLMDLIIIGSGIYVIYHYVLMVRTRKVVANMLLPKDIDPKKCNDTEGYINYIAIKQLAFGIVALLCGAVGLLQNFSETYGLYAYLISMVLFLVVAVWYTVALKKAFKVYWGK